MSNTSENLGRPVAWQIRDIPESIRDAVVEQARVEKVNVAELVTRLVLEARAAGWSFNAANGFANASNRPDPARVRAASELLGNMGRAGVPVQKGVAALFNRLAKREARELLGMDAEEPRKLRKKALPAPANPSTDEIVQPPVTHNGDINQLQSHPHPSTTQHCHAGDARRGPRGRLPNA